MESREGSGSKREGREGRQEGEVESKERGKSWSWQTEAITPGRSGWGREPVGLSQSPGIPGG